MSQEQAQQAPQTTEETAQEEKKFPTVLNDGEHWYWKRHGEIPLPDGRKFCAVYEKIPQDPAYVFTPDLAFTEGQTQVPIMHPLMR